MMRIAIVTELFHPRVAGCEKRFLEIGKRLVSRGHEVHVFTIRYEKGLPKEDVVDGINVHRYAYSRKYISQNNFRSLSGVLKYSVATTLKLFSNEFDVHYFNQWPLLHTFFSKPFCSPIVQEWCEVWFDRTVMLEKMLKKVTNHHVAVSSFTKERLVNFLGVNPDNVAVIPDGVDYNNYSQESHEKKWGRIVYVGRLVSHKHVDMLINAFHIAKQRASDIELYIIGSGPLVPLVKRLASRDESVYVSGQLSDERVLDVLRSSWLFVLPSEREGFGMAALEAMACGVPVITVDYPNNGAKCLIANGNGVVVQPSSNHIASTIQGLFWDEERWRAMSENARSFAAKYDWETIIDITEEYLKRVISES